MNMKVQVVIESDEGQQRVEEIASLTRGALSADTLGLRLAEVKKVLRNLQQTMVTQQVKEFLDQHRHCGQCGAQQSLKGHTPWWFTRCSAHSRCRAHDYAVASVSRAARAASAHWSPCCRSAPHQSSPISKPSGPR